VAAESFLHVEGFLERPISRWVLSRCKACPHISKCGHSSEQESNENPEKKDRKKRTDGERMGRMKDGRKDERRNELKKQKKGGSEEKFYGRWNK
jgi:hypothetical protein